ncbi:helix-turn-helix transcriptional regulator [Vagococcus carniphilus]|uniref:Helix-turn-helix transcriptional regulator n=1 Tax=Vagococcus carniphilus TaxID=218144 RepID=A0AAW8U8W1_9ENTE|nr:helix-turn-helix transcriptional regulator [Vagococcus carniphilus]MDT2815937.1 helix-turn-helix transcriptional regulator [Vagococcus carniphilus]MDT2831849.1 helix-turn-helix transcriptional regulator [Vagococcus carniphilus]MDT2834426.1 helix-turn-helix transcriptional regulator [Vagococcus carniphilus]MDT2839343.1 helix-turn-helix transcriptional regulator [Vagococcus carniphilus]MDT2849977.1 helix-turn-helix transcriptional regulator [Vagococcus carniphilus]
MELSERQKAIIEIVKANEPISGDKIAESLGLTKPTLRSDLAVLTMTGVLDARPKVGYIYSGLSFEPLLHEQLFETKVEALMTPSIIVFPKTTVRDATTSLFMYDSGSLYVTDETTGDLIGLVSRKDLLRSLLNNQDNDLSVAVIMTRMPNIIVSYPEMSVLEAGRLLTKHEVDSLPVVEEKDSKKVIGKISKTRIMEHFIKMGSERN